MLASYRDGLPSMHVRAMSSGSRQLRRTEPWRDPRRHDWWAKWVLPVALAVIVAIWFISWLVPRPWAWILSIAAVVIAVLAVARHFGRPYE